MPNGESPWLLHFFYQPGSPRSECFLEVFCHIKPTKKKNPLGVLDAFRFHFVSPREKLHFDASVSFHGAPNQHPKQGKRRTAMPNVWIIRMRCISDNPKEKQREPKRYGPWKNTRHHINHSTNEKQRPKKKKKKKLKVRTTQQ